MSHRRHRFGFSRRGEPQITPDDFESMLGETLPSADSDTSFEDAVLGRVAQSRPFLSAHERKKIRWGRAAAIGLGIGLFTSGVMSVRAGVFSAHEEPGVVSSIVNVVQSESQTPVESVSNWRNEALAKLTASRRAQNDARPERCREAVRINDSTRDAGSSMGGFVTIGLSMRHPGSAFPDQASGLTPTVIIFEDGLAIPAGSATSACPRTSQRQTAHWPDPVKHHIGKLGLEGSCELAVGGSTPPWYGSDVVRLPRTPAPQSNPPQTDR